MPKQREPIDDLIDAFVWMANQRRKKRAGKVRELPNAGPAQCCGKERRTSRIRQPR
jgi:hypothetical protein